MSSLVSRKNRAGDYSLEKNIKSYKQRGNTCAIACMLMVLEYYKVIPKADWHYERKYFKSYHSRYIDGTPFSALAYHFAKNNLYTEMIHSEINMFDNSNKLLSDDIFEKTMEEYKEYLRYAEEKGAKIINGLNINGEMLKQKIEEGKLVILAGQINNYLHAILLCGYENNNFIVCDPLYKQKQLKIKEEIELFMNTDIGKWCVTVDKM